MFNFSNKFYNDISMITYRELLSCIFLPIARNAGHVRVKDDNCDDMVG